MGLVERILQLCKEKGYTVAELEKKTSMGERSLYNWARTEPKAIRLLSVADVLGVSTRYLLTGEDTYCPICGYGYLAADDDGSDEHKKNHESALEAKAAFGFYWCSYEREAVKSESRNILSKAGASEEEKREAQINVYKALFCRSVQTHGVAGHPSFPDYVAMMLGQPMATKTMDKCLYDALYKQYGVAVGMEDGTTIYRGNEERNGAEDSRVADEGLKFALFGGSKGITDAQFEEVKRFAQYVKEREAREHK